MTDRPIDIPASRIPALLDGRMTQYRTPLKPQPVPRSYYQNKITTLPERNELFAWFGRQWEGPYRIALPHAIGDRLWVREETWCDADGNRWYYAGTQPRWASRITLTVTDLAVHRVQDISEADAKAEGVLPILPHPNEMGLAGSGSYRLGFGDLYNTTHGPDAWERNDWVLAHTFRVDLCNIDQMETSNA